MRKNWFLGLFLAMLLVGVSACGGGGDGGDPESEDKPQAGQENGSAGPGAVPAVVAEVNGEEIPKDEFVDMYEAQRKQMARNPQSQIDGNELKKQVVQSMISTELLMQEAEKRGLTASKKDVDETLQGLAEQNRAGSVDAFIAALKKQGMDREDVEAQVRSQVMIEKLVSDETGNIEPTDKQVRALYEQMVAQQEQAGGQGGQTQVPPFKQVRPQLKEQLKSQKQSEVAKALVDSLRERADVVVNL